MTAHNYYYKYHKPVRLSTGRKKRGTSFSRQSDYQKYKRLASRRSVRVGGRESGDHRKIQYSLVELTKSGPRVLERSGNAGEDTRLASVGKILTLVAFLRDNQSQFTPAQLQQAVNLIAASDNGAWTEFHELIGGGSASRGREKVKQYMNKMGYGTGRAARFMSVDTLSKLMNDVMLNQVPGVDTTPLVNLMYTCQTGNNRGNKYIDDNVAIATKTGSHTENGADNNIQTLAFQIGNRKFAITVAANQYGSSAKDIIAVIAGGLYNDLIQGKYGAL